MKREKNVTIRLTKEEYEMLLYLADLNGCTMTDILLYIVHQNLPK